MPPTGTARESLPFFTAVGVPAALLVVAFLLVFRDSLNLQHHFALMALACGIFFFSYALRYYITTAAVMGTVLFGDRLRRQRILSGIRAGKQAVEPGKAVCLAAATRIDTPTGPRPITDVRPRVSSARPYQGSSTSPPRPGLPQTSGPGRYFRGLVGRSGGRNVTGLAARGKA